MIGKRHLPVTAARRKQLYSSPPCTSNDNEEPRFFSSLRSPNDKCPLDRQPKANPQSLSTSCASPFQKSKQIDDSEKLRALSWSNGEKSLVPLRMCLTHSSPIFVQVTRFLRQPSTARIKTGFDFARNGTLQPVPDVDDGDHGEC